MMVDMVESEHEQDLIDAAWHEAGHVIGYWAAGVSVVSVKLAADPGALGQQDGGCVLGRVEPNQKQADLLAEIDDAGRRATRIVSLAGDVARVRRCRELERPVGNLLHVQRVRREVGSPALGELRREARALVDEHWAEIEAIATALLASPDLALYATRAPVLTPSPDAGYPAWADQVRRSLAEALPPAHGVLGVFPGDGGALVLYCRCGSTFEGKTPAAAEALHAAHRR